MEQGRLVSIFLENLYSIHESLMQLGILRRQIKDTLSLLQQTEQKLMSSQRNLLRSKLTKFFGHGGLRQPSMKVLLKLYENGGVLESDLLKK